MTGDDLTDALDALESMVTQYLDGDYETGWDHVFMSAGEKACRVLALHRPERWELTSTGLVPRDEWAKRMLETKTKMFNPPAGTRNRTAR